MRRVELFSAMFQGIRIGQQRNAALSQDGFGLTAGRHSRADCHFHEDSTNRKAASEPTDGRGG